MSDHTFVDDHPDLETWLCDLHDALVKGPAVVVTPDGTIHQAEKRWARRDSDDLLALNVDRPGWYVVARIDQ